MADAKGVRRRSTPWSCASSSAFLSALCITLNLSSGGEMRAWPASQERGFERVPAVMACLMLRGGSASGAWMPPAVPGNDLPWIPQAITGDGGEGARTEGAGDASGSMDEQEGKRITAGTPEEALRILQVAACLQHPPISNCRFRHSVRKAIRKQALPPRSLATPAYVPPLCPFPLLRRNVTGRQLCALAGHVRHERRVQVVLPGGAGTNRGGGGVPGCGAG